MDKSKILNEIRNIIKFAATTVTKGKNLNFIDVKSGDNIIRTMGDDFVVGEEVFLVTPEGEIPAPDGEHTLDDGRTIIVAAGVLTEIREVEQLEEEKEEEEIVEEFESELEIDEEEGKVKDEVTMKKMKEAEDKIVMLEKKIGDLEEVVTEMAKGYGKVSKYSKDLETKFENFMKGAPAEAWTNNYKSEYKSQIRESKNSVDQKLETFRSIRNK